MTEHQKQNGSDSKTQHKKEGGERGGGERERERDTSARYFPPLDFVKPSRNHDEGVSMALVDASQRLVPLSE
jgi:hypothetical protein